VSFRKGCRAGPEIRTRYLGHPGEARAGSRARDGCTARRSRRSPGTVIEAANAPDSEGGNDRPLPPDRGADHDVPPGAPGDPPLSSRSMPFP
jgi:hypothetical protein